MEKLLYPLWKAESEDAEAFRERLLNGAGPRLLDLGVRGLRLAVVDSDVAPAAGLRQEKLGPALDAMLSIWVDSANDRSALEAIVGEYCVKYAGYVVTESEPLRHLSPEGARMGGWTQVVFLERPAKMAESDWLSVWLGSHTDVAIRTQSTFAYRQNVVVRSLTDDAPAVHAIVEESFPGTAMNSPHAFYDADSDEALNARLSEMVESCARFIDFERLNVVPTSEYLLKGL